MLLRPDKRISHWVFEVLRSGVSATYTALSKELSTTLMLISPVLADHRVYLVLQLGRKQCSYLPRTAIVIHFLSSFLISSQRRHFLIISHSFHEPKRNWGIQVLKAFVWKIVTTCSRPVTWPTSSTVQVDAPNMIISVLSVWEHILGQVSLVLAIGGSGPENYPDSVPSPHSWQRWPINGCFPKQNC